MPLPAQRWLPRIEVPGKFLHLYPPGQRCSSRCLLTTLWHPSREVSVSGYTRTLHQHLGLGAPKSHCTVSRSPGSSQMCATARSPCCCPVAQAAQPAAELSWLVGSPAPAPANTSLWPERPLRRCPPTAPGTVGPQPPPKCCDGSGLLIKHDSFLYKWRPVTAEWFLRQSWQPVRMISAGSVMG